MSPLKTLRDKVRCILVVEDASRLGGEVKGKWKNNVVRKAWRREGEK